MKDVAAAAGCSQTTVSFVLNSVPGHNIRAETRRRVAEAAVALGYVPHAAPTARRNGHSLRAEAVPRIARAATGRARASASVTFTDRVARALAIDILSGRRAPGSTLPHDLDLMAEFGVSRTVLREAVKMLTGKGLLEAKTRVGTRVRPRSQWHLFDPDVLLWQAEAGLDKDFIGHLGEIRLILEPEAAALAALRRSNADVEHLMQLADRMAARGISAEGFAKADLNFHLAVSATAQNPFLNAVSALIEVALMASMRRSWPGDVEGGVARSAERHRDIARAIAEGDSDAARAAMRSVIVEGTTRSM